MKTLTASLAVLALIAGCATPSATAPPSPSSLPSPAPTATTTPTPRPTPAEITPAPTPQLPSIEDAGATRIVVEGDPDWIAIAGGSAWTAARGGALRLDATSGEPGSTITLDGSTCLAFDVQGDDLWAATCETRTLWRIDTMARVVASQVELPVQDVQWEGSVGAGEGGIWVVSTDHKLVKVDPATTAVVDAWDLPEGAAAVRAGLGAVWVTVSPTNTLLRIDPADPTQQTAIPTGAFPRFLAVGEGAVWVMNQHDGTVTRVAPDGTVEATIAASSGAIEGGDITVGGGRAWVRTWNELVTGIDPATNTVVERYGPTAGSGSVAADDTALWVTAHDVSAVWRLPLPPSG